MSALTSRCSFSVKHTHLPVSDRQATIAFFERHFGFKREYDVPRGEAQPATVIRSLNGFQLTLENATGTPEIPRWFHLGLLVPSPDACHATYKQLQACGVEILEELVATDRYVTFICADPDGYALQVYWDPAEMPLADPTRSSA